MQHIILLLLALGLIALALTLTAIIKESGRTKTVLPALLCLVILFVLLWYFTPAQYNLDENTTITIIYTAKDTTINTDFEQNRELKSLIADLSYKRPFFNGVEHQRFDNDEYVYILITDVSGKQPFIGLHITLNQNGFTQGKGTCFDNHYAEVINAQPLIAYVKKVLQTA